MTDFFEHIEDYCENLLSEKDKAVFEQELTSNEELRNAVDNYSMTKDMAGALLQMDILESIELAKASPSLDLSDDSIEDRNYNYKKLCWFWLVAIFCLGALAVYVISTKNDKNQANQKLQFAQVYKEPIWPIVRSSEDTLMQKGMYLFLQKGEIEGAKVLILQDTLISEEMRRYWVAEMYLKKEVWDSVRVYLPEMKEGDVKAERVGEIRGYLEGK